jgi:hypothetical protein
MHYFAKKLAPTPGDGQPLFTENPRRRVFSESELPVYGVLGEPNPLGLQPFLLMESRVSLP